MACRTGQDSLDGFYDRLAEELSLKPQWFGPLPEGISVQPRGAEGHTWLFVMNFSEEEKSLTLNQAMTDAVTGEHAAGTLTLTPYEVRVLRIDD